MFLRGRKMKVMGLMKGKKIVWARWWKGCGWDGVDLIVLKGSGAYACVSTSGVFWVVNGDWN